MLNMMPLLVTSESLKKMLVKQEELNIKYNGEDWRAKVSMSKVKFAILDEVSEFLREIESTWKWWKHDPAYNRQKALYELIDIIHFALLALLKRYDQDYIIKTIELDCHDWIGADQFGPFRHQESIEEFFSYVLSEFLTSISHDNAIGIIQRFCNLVQAGGELIGIDNPDEIYSAYVMKNQRNHERVDGGVMEGKYDKSKESDIPSGK